MWLQCSKWRFYEQISGKKNLVWIDMTLRFLTFTLNAFNENLVMKIFYKNKFMLKQKCTFSNFLKGEWVTKTLKGLHLCLNSFIFKHLNTWISNIKFYNYYNIQSHSVRILKCPVIWWHLPKTPIRCFAINQANSIFLASQFYPSLL